MYCGILTNEGTTLRTVNIIRADFHPTIEVHLSERKHIARSVGKKAKQNAALLKYYNLMKHTSSGLGWPVLGSKKAKVLTSNLLTCE